MKIKKQLSRSAILEAAVQVSSVGISFYLIDLRGFPFLANRNNPNSNILSYKISNKQKLDIQ